MERVRPTSYVPRPTSHAPRSQLRQGDLYHPAAGFQLDGLQDDVSVADAPELGGIAQVAGRDLIESLALSDGMFDERGLASGGRGEAPSLVGDQARLPRLVGGALRRGFDSKIPAGWDRTQIRLLAAAAGQRPADVAYAADGGHHFLGDLVGHKERAAGAKQA